MPPIDEPEGAKAPESGTPPPEKIPESGAAEPTAEPASPAEADSQPGPSDAPTEYDTYPSYEEPYGYEETPPSTAAAEESPATPAAAVASADGGSKSPPPEPPNSEPKADEDDEEGMLRMSFLEHLDELRSRIIKALAGVGIAFAVSLVFANQLWIIVSDPAMDALRQIGLKDPRLAQITPMEVFSTVWVKLPILTAIFLASPWILYQVWAFIAPGLFRRERRWAAPFVLSSAGLFILGGLFAYFVAFRFGLVFLLGIGRDIRIQPVVSVTEYFDLFVNVILGVSLVFELPILVFFLVLLRIATPAFLLRNSRYAILVIAIIAAVVTPTPDVFNMMLFAVPMWILYFIGIFAGYLLVLHRENRRFPWMKVFYWILAILAVAAAVVYIAVTKYGYKLVLSWPFLKL
jgi:sec-independent protein translocase protein TatC